MTPARLQALWADLNARYFRGTLPPIEIQWSRRLTSSTGMFVSRVGPRARPRPERHRVIRLSVPLLRGPVPAPERELLATLAHEMIHQWQYDRLRRRPDHGAEFRRKMVRMNRDGLGIAVRHDLEEAVRAFVRHVWRCTRCGCLYERQRRSISPIRHRCGRCRGPLREVPPAERRAPRRPKATPSRRSGRADPPVQLRLAFD